MSCDEAPPNPPDVEMLFADPSSPETRTGELSYLCSFGMTPLLVSGMLRTRLTAHFIDPNNAQNPVIREILQKHGPWSPDATKTGIMIESITRWKPELTEFRPAVLLKSHGWQWHRKSIGDQNGSDWRSGREFYQGLWYGSHTLFVIGNEDVETDILAAEVARLVLWSGPGFVESFGLHRFVIVSIGELQSLKESTTNYVVPVTVAYVREEGWSLQEEQPRLKRIKFNVNEALGRIDADT